MIEKDHAVHNERACDFLLSSGEFNDWVVTTTFYAALHYVRYELFPLERNNVIYNNFEKYFSNISKKENMQSQHKALIRLVETELYSCAAFYRYLYDQCRTARYVNYSISNDITLKAMESLKNIKLHLNKT